MRNRDLVAHHIIENAKSGDIVLLHDPYDTSVEAALQTIDVLSEQGYEFVTLEELFSNAGVTPQAGHFYLRADEEVRGEVSTKFLKKFQIRACIFRTGVLFYLS